MHNQKDIQLLKLTYAAVLADATAQFAKENALQNVTQRKKAEQMATGKMKAEQFGITSPADNYRIYLTWHKKYIIQVYQ